jgi:hypothetical protein
MPSVVAKGSGLVWGPLAAFVLRIKAKRRHRIMRFIRLPAIIPVGYAAGTFRVDELPETLRAYASNASPDSLTAQFTPLIHGFIPVSVGGATGLPCRSAINIR